MEINNKSLLASLCRKHKKHFYFLFFFISQLIVAQTHSVPSSGNNTWNTCSGTLYDNGGASGNYVNNSNGYTVVTPSAVGNLIKISTATVNLEGGDVLTIYDGVGTSGTILWQSPISGNSCTNTTMPDVISLSGSLTVELKADGDNRTCSGFALSISCIPPCSGTPTGGTTVLSSSTGSPSSTFTASVSGASIAPGFTYQWQWSSDNVSWNDISGATSATATITAMSTYPSTTYYRRKITCTNSGVSSFSSSVTFSTDYCAPTFNTSNTGKLYIRSFKYIGVLNDDFLTANVSTQSGTNGAYQDFTNLTPKAEQVRGSVVNIESICTGTVSSGSTVGWGYWMAWVDWNHDGVFSSSEVVYTLQNYSTGSVTFGFIIPANQALGDYRIRISVTSAKTTSSCGLSTSYGEVEDYVFSVVEDNNAKLDTTKPSEFNRCDAGVVPMVVYGSDANAVDFKWYDAKYGGNLLSNGANYAPNVSATTTFYVSVVDTNGKETPFRYPIVARIDPIPQVTFTPTPETICGEDDPYLLLSVWGDNREVTLFDEKFNSGLGAFNNEVADTYLGADTTPYSYNWTVNASPYAQTNPPHEAIASSVSSGYFGGNFAIMNSDGAERINKNVLRHLVSTSTYDTTLFLANQIKLDFDLYYFSIALLETDGYFKVEYSTDGTNWTAFKTYVLNTGNPLFWNKVSIDLDASGVPRSSNLRIRFSLYSRGFSSGYYESVATLDNIKLYGKIPLDRDFDWSGADNAVLYDKTCTTPLGNTLAREVCVKPPLDEFEKPYWTLQASATFQSGCPAIGSTVVYNDTKIWNQPGKTDWKQSDDWKPVGVPDIKKCVIARTPVVLPTGSTGTHGLARSVIVKAGGKLTVEPKSSLTIQNYIKNEAAATDVIVESDANLIQNNNAAVNIGDITVRRNVNLKRLDYNLWGAPVTGQNVRNFSPGTLDNRFYVYNETNDYFDGLFVHNEYPSPDPFGNIISTTPTENMATYNFVKGLGYGIRASNVLTSTVTNVIGEFKGVPNNGIVTVPVYRSPDKSWDGVTYVHGFNMISNPFPSTIDFDAFIAHGTNSTAIYSTAYFWTNTNFNPRMQGSKYPSNLPSGKQIINNYAVLNATGGVAAPYGADGDGITDPIGSSNNCPTCKVPNKYIAPGQGFIVKARNLGNSQVEFDNSIRTNNQTAIFFNRMSVASKSDSKDRFWLNLKTPLDFNTTLLIGYIKGATDNFEEDYDGKLLLYAGDTFYSILNNQKLAIQGRKYPLRKKDVVNLGASFGLDGQYEISLVDAEGVFDTEQIIYLKDNLTGTITDLSQDKYTFNASAGDSTDRFQIQYQNKKNNGGANSGNVKLKVYQTKNQIIVESVTKVKRIKVINTFGKIIYNQKENDYKVIINSAYFKQGFYILEVETSKGKEFVKILK